MHFRLSTLRLGSVQPRTADINDALPKDDIRAVT